MQNIRPTVISTPLILRWTTSRQHLFKAASDQPQIRPQSFSMYINVAYCPTYKHSLWWRVLIIVDVYIYSFRLLRWETILLKINKIFRCIVAL